MFLLEIKSIMIITLGISMQCPYMDAYFCGTNQHKLNKHTHGFIFTNFQQPIHKGIRW